MDLQHWYCEPEGSASKLQVSRNAVFAARSCRLSRIVFFHTQYAYLAAPVLYASELPYLVCISCRSSLSRIGFTILSMHILQSQLFPHRFYHMQVDSRDVQLLAFTRNESFFSISHDGGKAAFTRKREKATFTRKNEIQADAHETISRHAKKMKSCSQVL